MDIIILGSGVSGRGAAALAEKLGHSFAFANDGDTPIWGDFDLCVASPGFAADSPLICGAKSHGLEVISEMEFAYRHFNGKILAITGTNGKTTTTELTCALLQSVGVNACCAGNIGLPLSSLCASIIAGEVAEDTVAVLEVSSFQLEHVRDFAPYSACFTNLASDHLNRYDDSIEKYKSVKMRIFNGVPQQRRFFGSSMEEKNFSSPISIEGELIFYQGKLLADFRDCKLDGRHNLQNIECALNLVSTILAPQKMLSAELAEALLNFKAGRHRIEKFEFTFNGRNITGVNDSKATNPHSVIAACTTFAPPEKNLRIVLGGLDKDMDFAELLVCVPYFAKCYLIGEAENKLYDILSPYVPCEKFGTDFRKCCHTAAKEAQIGDIVILSPACASMDMFKNYAERGDLFKEYLQNADA